MWEQRYQDEKKARDAEIAAQMMANQELVTKLVALQAKAESIQSIDNPEDYAKALTGIDDQFVAVVSTLPQVFALLDLIAAILFKSTFENEIIHN